MSILNYIECTYVYEGIDNVTTGLSEYHYERNDVHMKHFQKKSEKINEWEEKNNFYIFIHKDTRVIMGVRTTHGEKICPWKLLFISNYVPVSCHPDIIPLFASAGEITATASAVLDRFLREVDEMFSFTDETLAMPLFLLGHFGYNNYYAWSMQEGKLVEVFNYKSYRHTFTVRDVVGSSSPSSSDGRYVIIPPSDELVKCLGLPLSSSVFSKKCQWDEWFPRAPIQGCCDIIPRTFRSRYGVCIETLNRSYAKDMGRNMGFYQLEERVRRLERLCRSKAPERIISDEIKLIERVLSSLENLQ